MPVVAATQAFGQTASNRAVVTIPLPAVGQASIETVTVHVKGRGPGKLRIKDLNDKQFGNSSSVTIVQGPAKPTSNPTYVVSFLTKRFPSPDRVVSTGRDAVGVQIAFKWETSGNSGAVDVGNPQASTSCGRISTLDGLFERSSTVFADGVTFWLQSIRPQSAQDSPPEEVLDNVMALVWTDHKCPGQPEGDDAGNK